MWLRVYTDAASRSADASRPQGTEPDADTGVVAEIVTTGPGTVKFTPAAIGWNNDTTTTNTAYLSVRNVSTSAGIVSANVVYIVLEA